MSKRVKMCICLSVCPLITLKKWYLCAFHRQTSALFAIKLFPSVPCKCEMVIGNVKLSCTSWKYNGGRSTSALEYSSMLRTLFCNFFSQGYECADFYEILFVIIYMLKWYRLLGTSIPLFEIIFWPHQIYFRAVILFAHLQETDAIIVVCSVHVCEGYKLIRMFIGVL